MYIEKYWDNYIGGSDDSLTLLEYLASKEKETISLQQIFEDSGLDQMNGEFQQTEEIALPVEGFDADICNAISLIVDLAALLLECKMNGSVNLEDFDADGGEICITATPEDHELMNKALEDFIAAPLDYDLSDMMDEEEMQEMAALCEKMRQELYE